MADTAEQYRRFAAMEARGASPLYEQLALGVAGDRDLLDLLSALPPAKRQPNLLFAATRYVSGTPSGYDDFRLAVLANRDTIVATMLSRRTQTNEPARCAALYPLLASLPQPLALIEVGASAGLCLLPDRYAYTYSYTDPADAHTDRHGHSYSDPHGDGPVGAADSPLRLHCQVKGTPPARFAEPGPITVAWRAGLDLNPLDVTNPDDVQWLRTLVWPGQRDRLRRLNTAIALAQSDPPRIVRGDLTTALAGLAAQAPPSATLVVFHTAVLYYVPEADRATFVEQVERLDGHWISQEGPDVLPDITARLHQPPPSDTVSYVLALDHEPVAISAMHGGWMDWSARG
ncbi:DUF2332 domain-containing protein [Nonomuraea sp. KM90]|uniref:DUF2332 domain-containing protein n=1 Tax=Nonomuraea sp. KM90 TaxID=3457428 RepID=UPI003FCC9806